MGDRTWVNLKCRKADLDKIRVIIDGPGPREGDYPAPFDEILNEDQGGQWIEGQIHEANYGLYGPMEEIAEAGIPFVASSGPGGDYGPAVIACDGKRLFHLGASWDGYPYVEINGNGDFLPEGVMQRIREYYIIVEDAERIIEGLPPIPIEMRTCTLDKGKPCPHTSPKNLCQCCGLYFCDVCWDKHDECEPCSDCGQMHITTPCPASPA